EGSIEPCSHGAGTRRPFVDEEIQDQAGSRGPARGEAALVAVREQGELHAVALEYAQDVCWLAGKRGRPPTECGAGANVERHDLNPTRIIRFAPIAPGAPRRSTGRRCARPRRTRHRLATLPNSGPFVAPRERRPR